MDTNKLTNYKISGDERRRLRRERAKLRSHISHFWENEGRIEAINRDCYGEEPSEDDREKQREAFGEFIEQEKEITKILGEEI